MSTTGRSDGTGGKRRTRPEAPSAQPRAPIPTTTIRPFRLAQKASASVSGSWFTAEQKTTSAAATKSLR